MKFIEVTDSMDEKWLLNLGMVRAVSEMDKGNCIILGLGNDDIRAKESYEEIKAMILKEDSKAYIHLEKQFRNAVERIDFLTSQNIRYEKALEENW